MKQNHRIMWIHILIILLSLIFLIGVGIGSFVLIKNMFETKTVETEAGEEQKIIADIALDTVSTNIIYKVDEDCIEQAVLEIFNSNSGELDYVTIPGNTELTISNQLSKRFRKYNILTSKKTVRINELVKYFENDSYQVGQLLIGDTLGIELSYYTAIQTKEFVKYFVEDSEIMYVGKKKYEYDIQEFSETFKTKLKQFDLQLEELISDSYNELNTNFNLNNRLKYLSKYDKTDVDKIYYWHIIGEMKYGKFVIDTKTNTAMLSKIISRKEQYKITQDEYNNICKGKVK